MREIKFRAWDTDKNKMVKVDTIDFYNGNVNDVDFYNQEMHFGFSTILLQYTGLKDKNGTEIYEGDILKHRSIAKHYKDKSIHEIIGEVTKEIGMTYVRGVCNHGFSEEEITTEKYGALLLSPDLFEVIGNIYEHSHLIK